MNRNHMSIAQAVDAAQKENAQIKLQLLHMRGWFIGIVKQHGRVILPKAVVESIGEHDTVSARTDPLTGDIILEFEGAKASDG